MLRSIAISTSCQIGKTFTLAIIVFNTRKYIMNVKNILSAFVLLAVVTSPVTALAVEPTGHDHAAAKGIPGASGSTVKQADKDCIPTQAQGAGDDKAKPSQESKAKCVPKQKEYYDDQKHDHAKSKSLP
jgi:hypothetical protein